MQPGKESALGMPRVMGCANDALVAWRTASVHGAEACSALTKAPWACQGWWAVRCWRRWHGRTAYVHGMTLISLHVAGD